MEQLKKDLHYYNVHHREDRNNFICQIKSLKKQVRHSGKNLVFLCIGSDRATGDCFGPLVGEALLHHFSKSSSPSSLPIVLGTLHAPVHAMNLEKTILNIQKTFYNPYIAAIDASLGVRQHVGFVTFGNGPLLPGIGVRKSLPQVGDVSITGIVNLSGSNSHGTLQTTRLSTVMELADFVSGCILNAYRIV